MKSHDFLKKHNACSDASTFAAQHKTLRSAWDACPRPDWMLRLLGEAGYEDDRMYRLFGCWCACNTPLPDGRVTWDLLTDKRSRDAVKVAIRYANGEATQEELAAARDAAWDAARAAWDAARAAGYAARAAWDAAWAAWDAARAAARAAGYAAGYAAGAAGDAARAAGDAARAAGDAGDAGAAAGDAQANHLRSVVDFKKLEKLIKEPK